MLSSDILEEQFGPNVLKIIKQSPSHRLIQTISRSNQTVLELSLVTFDKIDAYPDVHKMVLDGMSMGKAYSQSKIDFIRDASAVVKSKIPSPLQAFFGNDGLFTILNVSVYLGKERYHYCDIVEIYHPSVLWPQAITNIDNSIKNSLKRIVKLL